METDGVLEQEFFGYSFPQDPFENITEEIRFVSVSTGQLVYTNRAFIGYFTDQASTLQVLFQSVGHCHTVVRTVEETGRFSDDTFSVVTPGGTRLVLSLTARAIKWSAEEAAIAWCGFPVTALIVAQEELKSRNEQLNDQVEKFLYSASHGLKAPVTSILGLVNLLRMESREANVLELTSKIESCALLMDNLIHDFISVSRAAYQPLRSERISFESTIWTIINSHFADHHFSSINFEVKVSLKNPFYADYQRLFLIFENLLRNAIQFIDPNKVKPSVRVLVDGDETGVVIEIMDNGIGIPAQHVDNVFNLFYKASNQSPGIGLGLYLVKSCVGQLKGTVKVFSEIGFGTLVRISLPNHPKGLLISKKLSLRSVRS